MRKLVLIAASVFLSLALAAGCTEKKHDEHAVHEEHEEHAGHGEHEKDSHEGESEKKHEAHADENAHAHEGEEAGAHEGEEAGAHSEEMEISLSPEAMKMAEITVAKATEGSIGISLTLSGEVGFNEDRLVHITPRFSGIAREAKFRVGEFVNEGDVVAVIESNESMTPYSLTAPISGRIIEKHIAPGEHVSQEESVYLLADLSNVWVNLAVYPKDAGKIKAGQKVSIKASGSDTRAQGTVQYITPVMDPQTRRITARVVLPNADNQWRPGTFVSALVEVGSGEKGVIVNKDAVQILENEHVVFIAHEPGTFKPVDVVVGESDDRRVRILSGLEPGSMYVSKGAFELKAKIVTSSMGSHAGHGH